MTKKAKEDFIEFLKEKKLLPKLKMNFKYDVDYEGGIKIMTKKGIYKERLYDNLDATFTKQTYCSEHRYNKYFEVEIQKITTETKVWIYE